MRQQETRTGRWLVALIGMALLALGTTALADPGPGGSHKGRQQGSDGPHGKKGKGMGPGAGDQGYGNKGPGKPGNGDPGFGHMGPGKPGNGDPGFGHKGPGRPGGDFSTGPGMHDGPRGEGYMVHDKVIYVRGTPPRHHGELLPPPPPRRGYVWVDGRWTFDLLSFRWEWIPGYWMRARVGLHYVPGRWVSTHRGWFWVNPRWM